MRRVVIPLAVAAVVLTLGAGPATAASKKPVKLEGTVNVHGTKDVSKKSSATLAVELDDFFFGPTFIKAKAGEKVTLELENEGNAPHTFTSDRLGVDEQVAPGESANPRDHGAVERRRVPLLLPVPRGPGHAGRGVHQERSERGGRGRDERRERIAVELRIRRRLGRERRISYGY